MRKHIALALCQLWEAAKRGTLKALRTLGARPGGVERRFFEWLEAPPWEDSIANNITMARLRVGFWGMHGFYWPYAFLPGFDWAIAIAFVALMTGAVLDCLDGPVARKYNHITDFGRFADPLADKTIAWSAFAVLLHHYGGAWWLAATTGSIVFYDVGVTRLRKHYREMQTNRVAKAKQWPLDAGVIALLFGVLIDWNPQWFNNGEAPIRYFIEMAGAVLLSTAAVLAGISALVYRHQNRVRGRTVSSCLKHDT
ncbi:hypothetical protein A2853_00650 [Candidatus Kaiserbacteria bacterium RIFCSPHIGHO2_01_FULL_55_17]|uniref:CDP-alcohol phosphatidyltransferase family protein n=1 Tax=Candidatus Kaiserbacteria bacterium RIFCSPHIGHO2_01_FULL_55_17 TaxID=1798484 RepID=A0A1F6D7V9_9BACT|nr:MAG: hypothetical protein A2853_00650 [Candidatus Kaiserbacteria bacterium RIFCSPHIGHO2_01_FULL_55_17]